MNKEISEYGQLPGPGGFLKDLDNDQIQFCNKVHGIFFERDICTIKCFQEFL